MNATATCMRQDCTWTVNGPAAAVELEARRHGGDPRLAGAQRPGHPTAVETTDVLAQEAPR